MKTKENQPSMRFWSWGSFLNFQSSVRAHLSNIYPCIHASIHPPLILLFVDSMKVYWSPFVWQALMWLLIQRWNTQIMPSRSSESSIFKNKQPTKYTITSTMSTITEHGEALRSIKSRPRRGSKEGLWLERGHIRIKFWWKRRMKNNKIGVGWRRR